MPEFYMRHVRAMRTARANRLMTTKLICEAFYEYPRDEVIELIDACRRYPDDFDALDHVHNVLHAQRLGIPLINGDYASEVEGRLGR